jgi:uncharacterized membrane protein
MGIWMACLLAIGGNHSATVLIAAGGTATQVVQAEIGLLFVILGGYHLGQVSRTSLLGVRTPWTLTSDLAWNRCQRLAGSILVTMGIAVVGLALLGDSRLLVGSAAAGAGLFVITVMTYSYRVAKLDTQRQPAQ